MGGTAPPPNPIDDQRQFVRQQYLDFLNREPDGPGWDFWTDKMFQPTSPTFFSNQSLEGMLQRAIGPWHPVWLLAVLLTAGFGLWRAAVASRVTAP